jgi:copper chaperone
MITTTYKVTGMTCEHCVNSVTSEIGAIDGVSGIAIDLVPNGVSLMTITSTEPLSEDVVGAAMDEAGDYQHSRRPPAGRSSAVVTAGRAGRRHLAARQPLGHHEHHQRPWPVTLVASGKLSTVRCRGTSTYRC